MSGFDPKRPYQHPAIFERDLWNAPGLFGLLRLRAGELHHFAPLLDFRRDELAEIGGSGGKHGGAEVRIPRLDVGIGKSSIDRPIERVDDFGRRVPGRAYTKSH